MFKKMYTHVGRKIKTLAKVFAWIGIIFGLLLSLSVLISGCGYGITYLARGMWSGVLLIIGGILLAAIITFLWFLMAWISSWVLYGYGEIVDKTAETSDAIAELLSIKRAEITAAAEKNPQTDVPPAQDGVNN